jgi:phosphate acetyltransferase
MIYLKLICFSSRVKARNYTPIWNKCTVFIIISKGHLLDNSAAGNYCDGSIVSSGKKMEKKIFIASTEKRSGKSLVTLGLIDALQRIVPKVGYIKPVGQRYKEGSKIDEDAAMMKSIFGLDDDLTDINPLSMAEAAKDSDRLFENVFDSYKRISSGKDVVVIEGTDYTSTVSVLEFDFNAELANNLAAPVLLVAKGFGKSIDEIITNITEVAESFIRMGSNLLGVIINRYGSENIDVEREKLSVLLKRSNIPLFGVIPHNPALAGPRLKEVAEKLGAEIIFKGDELNKVVTNSKVLAMTPENALEHISDKNGYLLITPGDRVDIIFTVLVAQHSMYFPVYSGLILTGGLLPGENVKKLITGIANAGLTILSVKTDTYDTALRVHRIRGELSVDDSEKIELACMLVDRYVDFKKVYDQLGARRKDITTPRMFQYRILQIAKEDKKNIVLPEGTEPRILRAAAECLQREICGITLLGNRDEIMETGRNIGVNIGKANVINPVQDPDGVLQDFADTFYQLRKHKGVTKEMARDVMMDPVHYATMMVYKGHADGFVSGSTHSTAETLGPVLRIIRARKEVSLASSIFFMCMPDNVVVYGDCALVEDPNAEQLADIAITSAETARAFGINPFVAMLSYSTGESGKGKDVDKVREAAQIAKRKRPDLLIEGPLQYDAAISMEVARLKVRDSEVAGKATVYIFPDLDAGNTAYKAVQRSAKVPAIGPIVQGLNKPANDLSRGATVTDIIYTIAVTAIQAQHI